MKKDNKSVLVVGAGIAGLKVSSDLAELGFTVHLVESAPAVGGKLIQHDRWFPTDSCGFCQSLPQFAEEPYSEYCLRRIFVHPRVELFAYSELEKLTGKLSDFTATIRCKSRLIHSDKCILCNKCTEVCPVEVPNSFDAKLTTRKAAYRYCSGSYPATYTIDNAACTKCSKCVEVCPTNAIDLEMKNEIMELHVGAIVLAPGFDEFNPSKTGSYGYGRIKDVITSTEFERISSWGSDNMGRIIRPSTGKKATSIAFINCVGSRNTENPYCSSACCMFTLKQAIYTKQNYPDCSVTVFYMDMRAFGKTWWRYYQKAKELGINFIRCRVPAVDELEKEQKLKLRYEAENGAYLTEEADMVVLACGQVQNESTKKLASICGIEVNPFGFAVHQEMNNVKTSKDGIIVCGSFSEPKDISASVITASSAAAEVSLLLGLPEQPSVVLSKHSTNRKTAVLFFPSNLEEIIDTGKLEESISSIKNTVFFKEKHICSETATDIITKIKNSDANEAVIVGCIPYSGEALIEAALISTGIPSSKIRLVNLQYLTSLKDREKAYKRTLYAVLSALSELRLAKQYIPEQKKPAESVLIIGAGVCGLTAVRSLAELNIKVTLLSEESAGGNIEKIYAADSGEDIQAFFKELLNSVEENDNVTIVKNVKTQKVEGSVGNFRIQLSNNEKINAGAIIIATGATEYKPKKNEFPENDNVITMSNFEKMQEEKKVKVKSVVMMQCVGTLSKEHPYCSKICCQKAIKNALQLKTSNPKCEVYILYREVMTYGMSELKYKEAREAGIIFLRYSEDKPPVVKAENNKLSVSVFDSLLDTDILLNPDIVVLNTGIVPNNNTEFASSLGITIDSDGFFEEADSRFMPLETNIAGIFIAGLAQSPQNISEAISQGKAAATRAAVICSKKSLTSRYSTSLVSDRWCVGCELCVKVCPVNARTIEPQTKKAVVNDTLCVSCGACAVACPSAATELTRSDDRQILSTISNLIGD
ncbi:MAG: FAD-dependent oxidoreductase [Planctomycetota bacterium]